MGWIPFSGYSHHLTLKISAITSSIWFSPWQSRYRSRFRQGMAHSSQINIFGELFAKSFLASEAGVVQYPVYRYAIAIRTYFVDVLMMVRSKHRIAGCKVPPISKLRERTHDRARRKCDQGLRYDVVNKNA